MPNITDLRNRAKALGYRLTRRGTEYRLDHRENGTTAIVEGLEGVTLVLDQFEGKVGIQVYSACGRPLWNNAPAVARYQAKRGEG